MSIGWGIIGCGFIAGRAIAPAIKRSKEGELIAFLSREQEKANRFAAEFGAKCAYSRMADFLADERISAVYITTPNSLHCSQTMKAAQRGKNILCEKPLALNVQEAQKMIDICRQHGVNLMVGYMYRFHPAHQKIKSIIDEKKLGKILSVRSQYICPYRKTHGEGWSWRLDPSLSGGNSLMDLGTHCLDLLRVFNGEIRELTCFADNLVLGGCADDTAVLNLHFENGSYGIMDLSCTMDIQRQNYLEIYGENGYIRATGTIGLHYEPSLEVCTNATSEIFAYRSFDILQMYVDEINQFNFSIKYKRKPLIPGEEGLKNLEIIEAAYRSSESGKVEKVDKKERR